MTSTELEALIRTRLAAGGLWQMVDQHKSQFVEYPDGLFAEIVLNDASKVLEAEKISQELREFLAKQGLDLDVIVRANWVVDSVEGPKQSISISERIRAALVFPAVLVSGSQSTQVEVNVTPVAEEEIRSKVIEGEVDEKTALREVVKEFLRLQLSFGGGSYWDPIRYPRQDLNDSALLYLLGHGLAGRR